MDSHEYKALILMKTYNSAETVMESPFQKKQKFLFLNLLFYLRPEIVFDIVKIAIFATC